MEGLIFLFIFIVFVQLSYLLFLFLRLAVYRPADISSDLLPVSVIICAKNECEKLAKNLPVILEQDYPEFEVIVVNDNSLDDTQKLLSLLLSKYPMLTVCNIFQEASHIKGKKYPLTIGMHAARYKTVLLTDADCMPASKNWMRLMTGFLLNQKEIILGYAPYIKSDSFLNKFIRYETFLTALQYLSYAIAGIPYMGVGRNMSYAKKLFFEYNVFPKYQHLVSGDDDLLINTAANRINTGVQISKQSFTYSEAKKSWSEYWKQKKRHISTGKYYHSAHRFLLGVFSITHLLFYCVFILLLFYSNHQLEAGILFTIKLATQGFIFFLCMKKLGEEDLFWYFPLMDIVFLVYYIKLFPDVFQSKPGEWK